MNVLPKNIDKKYVYYFAPVKNTVIDSGRFIRVGYSDPVVNLNGIYTCVPFHVISTDRYFNKSIYAFDYAFNMHTINALNELESYVLSNVPDVNGLEPKLNLREQLLTRTIKVYNNDIQSYSSDTQHREIEILVKISGIWVTDNAYGLTFKFFDIVKSLT